MRPRTRAFLAGASLFGAVYAGVGWWVTAQVGARLSSAAVGELEREANLLARFVGDRPFTDSLADSLGRVAGLRVTLISPEGRVLGDSDVPARRLPRVENHAMRPEVRAALAGRVGHDRRASRTVARSLLYVAIPHREGVLRLAVSTREADGRVAEVRRALLLGGLLLLALAGAASAATTRLSSRPLHRLRQDVEAMATGEVSGRSRSSVGGELGRLARAVERLRDRGEALDRDLAARGEDLDAVLRTVEDGLAIVDRRGVVVRANRTFGALTGASEPEGRRLAALFRPPELSEALRRSVRGKPVRLDVELGGRRYAVSFEPHREGALIVFRDLTRLRRLEGVRRDFVANVSHELKTPLTSIVGFAEAMAESELPPEQNREFAGRIVANAGRMRALVDDLLDLSRIESGKWQPHLAEVDLVPLARGVWESVRSEAGERDVRMRRGSDSLPPVRADPEAVRQILRNLFDNALRYAPDGSEVVLSADREKGWIRVAVSDAGAGIPSAHLARIFERFYRVDPARSRQAGGTGLGLSIVRHLVEAHGGRVGADSELRVGTTVWFTLPAAPAPAGPTGGSSA